MAGNDRAGRHRTRAAVAAVAAAGLLVLAAAGSGTGVALLGHDSDTPAQKPAMPLVGNYLALALVILVVALVLPSFLEAHRERRAMSPKGQRGSALISVLIGVVLVVSALNLERLRNDGDGQKLGPKKPAQKAKPTPPEKSDTASSPGLGLAITIGLGVAIAGIVGGLAYLRITSRPRRRDALARRLAVDLEAALADLEAIDDPRAAVLACYDRLQRTVEAAGIARSPSDTPAELVERVLVEREVAAESVRRLAALFEHAKFSPHAVDEAMRLEALRAVADVRDQLLAEEAPAPEPLAAV